MTVTYKIISDHIAPLAPYVLIDIQVTAPCPHGSGIDEFVASHQATIYGYQMGVDGTPGNGIWAAWHGARQFLEAHGATGNDQVFSDAVEKLQASIARDDANFRQRLADRQISV